MDTKEGSAREKEVEPFRTSKRLGKGREVMQEDQSILKKLKSLIIPLLGGRIENCTPLKGVRFWNIFDKKDLSVPPTLVIRANGSS
jgi:hypothetical protein